MGGEEEGGKPVYKQLPLAAYFVWVPYFRVVLLNSIYFNEGCIRSELTGVYDEIIKWSRNLFMLPRGKSGERFIKELTRLLYLFVNKTAWESLSLQLVHVFIPIMLQKPSSKSKARDNAKYLLDRLEKWKNGDIKSLMDEARVIQDKLKRRKQSEKSSIQKGFSTG